MSVSGEQRILRNLRKSVETWNFQLMEKSVDEALKAGIPAQTIMTEGLGKGMESIGELFDKAKIYLPQVVAASRTVEGALKRIEPLLDNDGGAYNGTIVMGSVQGDIHEIGKAVCCAMLRGAGYKVVDLGADVSPDRFLEAAKENSADIVGGSALMTTTLPMQQRMVKAASDSGSGVMMIFGGAPCSQEWVDRIGGDGYSASGAEIVALVDGLMERRRGIVRRFDFVDTSIFFYRCSRMEVWGRKSAGP
ncbi:MAG: cobalamin-dependent protein [Candidatus Methanomethylophilaceae archaeon]|nr:cobalamin-dependent protein [Candidatus Methanomethylophilaceae archaeon]